MMTPRIPILPGERFGRLTVVRLVETDPHYGAVVEYACDCGGSTTRNAAEVRALARRGVRLVCRNACRLAPRRGAARAADGGAF